MTIQISERKVKKILQLYDEFSEIYGNEETVWELEDLDAMREIGQEFMNIFSIYFKK